MDIRNSGKYLLSDFTENWYFILWHFSTILFLKVKTHKTFSFLNLRVTKHFLGTNVYPLNVM
jgi:hypothetical protein